MSQLIVRPKPNAAYFELRPREATKVAWELAKRYGTNGRADMGVFKEWTAAYNVRWRAAKAAAK